MSDATARVRLTTTGMHCRSCSMLVDMTLQDLDGVSEAQTDLTSGTTEVSFDASIVSVDDLIGAIRAVGYEASLTT